jgi:hypothetical protein
MMLSPKPLPCATPAMRRALAWCAMSQPAASRLSPLRALALLAFAERWSWD